MNTFIIENWVSGDLDIESSYYRLLSYVQHLIKKSKYSRRDVLTEIEKKLIDLYCEHLNYTENIDKINLITIGQTTLFYVYEQIRLRSEKDFFKVLENKTYW